MTDFCVESDGTPGSIARIGEALGAAGINIEGLCLVRSGGESIVHFAVEDALTAERVLEDAGIRIREISEVCVLHKDAKCITGKPGSFGYICRAFTEHDITLKFGYAAEDNRFVFGVNDMATAQELLNASCEKGIDDGAQRKRMRCSKPWPATQRVCP